MVVGAAVAHCGERHDHQREDGHLTSGVAPGPAGRRVADAEQGIEDGQYEAEQVEHDQGVLHAHEGIASVHSAHHPVLGSLATHSPGLTTDWAPDRRGRGAVLSSAAITLSIELDSAFLQI